MYRPNHPATSKRNLRSLVVAACVVTLVGCSSDPGKSASTTSAGESGNGLTPLTPAATGPASG